MDLIKKEFPPSGKAGFEDLKVYQLAQAVMLNAHLLAADLPAEEKYDLVHQLRRASKSISANIAEGYGRFHYMDTLRFYSNAGGSLNETLSHLITANLLGYVEPGFYKDFYELVRETERVLNGLMRYVREQSRNTEKRIRELPTEYGEDKASYPDRFDSHET